MNQHKQTANKEPHAETKKRKEPLYPEGEVVNERSFRRQTKCELPTAQAARETLGSAVPIHPFILDSSKVKSDEDQRTRRREGKNLSGRVRYAQRKKKMEAQRQRDAEERAKAKCTQEPERRKLGSFKTFPDAAAFLLKEAAFQKVPAANLEQELKEPNRYWPRGSLPFIDEVVPGTSSFSTHLAEVNAERREQHRYHSWLGSTHQRPVVSVALEALNHRIAEALDPCDISTAAGGVCYCHKPTKGAPCCECSIPDGCGMPPRVLQKLADTQARRRASGQHVNFKNRKKYEACR
jgi:hypothetical protein